MIVASFAAPRDPELEALLGAQPVAQLHAELAARARRWAAAVAPGRAYEAASAAATEAALHDHEGPVLLAAPDVPALHERHATAALADLAAGAPVVIAPATDSTLFLVGLPRPDRALLELALGPYEGIMVAAQSVGAGLGLLRSERRLVSVADARALLADPLAPAELVAHLGALR